MFFEISRSMKTFRITKLLVWLAAFTAVALAARTSLAIEIEGSQPIAFLLPEINGSVQPATGGAPHRIDFGGELVQINTEPAYLDTGTSGIVISEFVADNWLADGQPIPRDPGVTFFDIALSGTVEFDVSMPVNIRIASSAATDVFSVANYETVYNQAYGPMRVQIGPHLEGELLTPPPNVFGMPVMMGKTVVIDPTVNIDQFTFQQTYIYDAGTPFNPAAVDTNPGIPTTSHHVKLSYGDFGRFTETIGGEGPQLNHNPLIGPNPLLALDDNPPVDDTPPVLMSFGGVTQSATMLFDTGAIASFISPGLADSMLVRYSFEVGPSGEALLESYDPLTDEGTLLEDQFAVPIAGIGGEAAFLSGFYLDELLLQTIEGGLDPNDPNHIRYLRAPVLVLAQDIELTDPLTEQTVILDGIFGMNFILASATLDLEIAVASPYRWMTFDEPGAMLGLEFAFIPEPSSYVLALCGLLSFAAYAWRRRQRRK